MPIELQQNQIYLSNHYNYNIGGDNLKPTFTFKETYLKNNYEGNI